MIRGNCFLCEKPHGTLRDRDAFEVIISFLLGASTYNSTAVSEKRMRKAVPRSNNESFTQLMGGITAFFLVVWVAAAYAVCMNTDAPTNFKYLFAGICLLGWAGCIMLSIG